ncbi:MAG TPA: Dabb family protein [Kiritimatiellia bacterium]|nr:Dabb family protein [Kiritimatiellia bacterium]
MIKHVVMWTFKEDAEGRDRAAVAAKVKTDLLALASLIPAIRRIEVGINQLPSDAACDICLLSEFDTWADLDTYRDHPAHQAVVAYVKTVVTSRHVVDYEV